MCNCPASHHHSAIVCLSVWSDLLIFRASCRSADLQPEVAGLIQRGSGRWAEAANGDFFDFEVSSFTQQMGKSCQGLQKGRRRRRRRNGRQELKNINKCRPKVAEGREDEDGFNGGTTRCRWGRTGGSGQDNQDSEEDDTDRTKLKKVTTRTHPEKEKELKWKLGPTE